VRLARLWLTDFRSYASADIAFAPGLTALLGQNGEGKTNVMEAIGYLATLSSFRGAPNDALVRAGASSAIVRAEGEREGRQLLIEAEIAATGRGRVQVNKQKLARTRDLLGALRVSVFAPDDLELVKGGPAERRRYLDDALVARRPAFDSLRSDLDRILRQRNALLKQSGGRLSPEVEATLMVWDAKFIETGEALADARYELVQELGPALDLAYSQVAGRPVPVTISYDAPWREQGLAAALVLHLDQLPSRTHASQGEQRSLALSLRLAAHRVVTDATGSPPILLLDDVFSELDPDRSAALLEHLPPGQTVLSSAAGLPPGASPELVLRVSNATIRPE
jgi:DNA replication and repair protein RecF